MGNYISTNVSFLGLPSKRLLCRRMQLVHGSWSTEVVVTSFCAHICYIHELHERGASFLPHSSLVPDTKSATLPLLVLVLHDSLTRLGLALPAVRWWLTNPSPSPPCLRGGGAEGFARKLSTEGERAATEADAALLEVAEHGGGGMVVPCNRRHPCRRHTIASLTDASALNPCA